MKERGGIREGETQYQVASPELLKGQGKPNQPKGGEQIEAHPERQTRDIRKAGKEKSESGIKGIEEGGGGGGGRVGDGGGVGSYGVGGGAMGWARGAGGG